MKRGRTRIDKIEDLPGALLWLRGETRLTQEKFAEAAGISKVYYGEVERGDKYPSDDVLSKILDALMIDLDRLKTVASTRPWDQMAYARSYEMSKPRMRKKDPDELSALFSKIDPFAPTDTESAELLAIYSKLGRSDQLTVLGVARSLGKHL